MSGLFGIPTPRRNDNRLPDRSDMGISFGDVDSFVEPVRKDRQRTPLKARSDNPRKVGEFTPLLRTATKKSRMMTYETPNQHADSSDSSAVDNSALTPVMWNARQATLDKSHISASTPTKASPARSELHDGPGGIREQEKAMDKMKKENWELKLKIFLMEKQMHQSSPEHVQLALKENIDYKVQVTSLSKDIAKYKRALSDTERKVASLGDQVSASMSQESCQLQHGMSEEERTDLERLESERDTLLDNKEEVEMRLRELEAENNRLLTDQAKYEDLEQQVDSLNVKLRKNDLTSEELEAANTKAQEALEDLERLQDDMEELRTKYDDLLSQTRSADNDEVVELLRSQLEEKTETIKSLSIKVRDHERELSTTQDRLESISKQLATFEERNDDLEAELEATLEELQVATKDRDNLLATRDTLEVQLSSAREMAAKTSAQIDQLEEDLQERQEDIEELKGAAQDQSFEYRQLEQRLNQQAEETGAHESSKQSALESELTNIQLVSREADREISHLKNRIQELEVDLESADSRDRARAIEITNLQEKVVRQQAESQAHIRESQLLQQKIESLSARSHTLEGRIQELESNDDIDSSQIQERLRDENTELRRQIEALETKVRESEEELDLLGDEVSQANAELTQLRKSAEEMSSSSERLQNQLNFSKQSLSELQLQLQSSHDKVILVEEARNTLQREISEVRQMHDEQQQKALALNTSLLNVRSMLSESQSAHKNEIQAMSSAHQVESKSLTSQCADLEAQLTSQITLHERTLEEAQSVRRSVERDLMTEREQIASLESTIARLSENEETINLDHARFKDVLHSEAERHRIRENNLQAQVTELEVTREELRLELERQQASMKQLLSDSRAATSLTEEKTHEIETLQSQITKLKQENLTIESSTQTSETIRQTLADQVDTLEAKILNLQESLSLSRREHQEQLLAKSDELFVSSQRLRDTADQLNSLEIKLVQTEQEKKRLSLAISTADQRVLASADRINELTSQNKDLESRLEQYAGEEVHTEIVETEKTRVRNELLESKEALREAHVEIEEIAAERDLLQDQVDEMTDALAHLRSETSSTIHTLRDEVRNARMSEMREAERANKIESDSADTLREETSQARAEERRLKLQVGDLQESLELAKQRHTDLLSNMGSSDAQMAASHKVIRASEMRTEELQQEKAQLQRKLDDLSQSHQLNQELENQLTDLEEELEETKKKAISSQSDLESRLQSSEALSLRKYSRIEQEKQQLLDDLQHSRSKQDELLKHQIRLEDDISDQRQSIHKLNGELHHLKLKEAERASEHTRKLDLTTREQETLKEQLSSAKHELERLRATTRSVESGSRLGGSKASVADEVRDVTRKMKIMEGDLKQKERKINELKAYGKEKAELVATLERRYVALQSQTRNNTRSNEETEARRIAEKRQKQHTEEIAGLAKMLRYMRSRTTREERFRTDLSYIKSYYDKQITSFEACNQANLAIIRQIGIYPDETFRSRKPSLKSTVHMVIATIRMSKSARTWAQEKAEKIKIDEAVQARKLRNNVR